jgi:type III restriction enzyme
MSHKIEFKFDANQEHQKQAVESVLGLFDGFPKNDRAYNLFADECMPNIAGDEVIDEEILFHNMKDVQERNGLSISASMNVDEGFVFPIQGKIGTWKYPSFTVEMETGTGKTYVYLRTMYELKRQFGFRKFIVIVPSVAIYEGVIKAIEITREHFRTLYHNEYMHLIKYDGSQLGQLRDYSHSQFLTVMVMTIASFNKITNNIFKPTEKLIGEKLPYEYIQETRPILVLDECQNYETETAGQALRTLNPLFALKYSATAGIKDRDGIWQYDNLIYQLDPLESFRRNLVKRIQVIGVTEGGNANVKAHFRIKDMLSGPKVKAEVIVNKKGRRELGNVTLKKWDNLQTKTKNDDYEGFEVENIDMRQGVVEFRNGERFTAINERQEAAEKRDIFYQQIEQTVRQHMELQEELLERGIKVLSLFFIDRVANYRGEDALIRNIFEEIFKKLKGGYDHFKNKNCDFVHEGYFAQKKTKDGVTEIDTDGGRNNEEREAEKLAFELIMRKKEQLLSFDEDVSFIFAHSALKEGWDNPNVFQICTLAQRYSERRKRQEIGRGMRLCVDKSGERIQDSKVNILTVVANESYEDFVNDLQSEYRETGNALPPPPSNAHREPAIRNDDVFKRKEFVEFWNKLIQRTNYNIQVDSEKVVNDVVARFSKEIVSPPEVIIKKGAYSFIRYELTLVEIRDDKAKIKVVKTSSDGDDEEIVKTYKLKSDLSKEINDKALDGFVVVKIKSDEVLFSNKQVLRVSETISFEVQKSISANKSVVWEKDRVFPVFNLINRAAEETTLTRKTVIDIFQKISEERRKSIFQNPEGFASAFIFAIKETLSDHVASHIEYFLLDELEQYDFSKVFPPEDPHPQKSLVKGSDASLYNYVQYESDVEYRFVQNRLNPDKKVVFYFKFPDSFKVKLPKIIGNYVPDWGIVREAESGSYTVELVRETKATLHENLLQYTNEKRKIWCAKKHFSELGLDYRHITDEVVRWWESDSAEEALTFDKLMGEIEIVETVGADEKFNTHLPLVPLEAVATSFNKEEYFDSIQGWIQADIGKNFSPDMFVAKVVGKSMEPTIRDGDYCVFRFELGGSREGKIVLANCTSLHDPDSKGQYTIKKYHSEKEYFEDGTWRHKKIVLQPDNKNFPDIVLENVLEGDFRIIAEFICRLGT